MKKIILLLLLLVCGLSFVLISPKEVDAYGENYPKKINYNVDSYIQSSELSSILDAGGYYSEIVFSYSILTNNYFDANENFVVDFIELDYFVVYSDGVDIISDNDTIAIGDIYITDFDFDSIMLDTNTYNAFTSAYLLQLYTHIEFVSGEDYITINIVLSNLDDTFYYEINNLVIPLINQGNTNDFVLVNSDGYTEFTDFSVSNAFTDFAYQVYVENTTQHPTPLEPNVDMWSWLGDTIGGFMDFEIFPSFSIGAIFNIVISIALFLIFLKVFVGG